MVYTNRGNKYVAIRSIKAKGIDPKKYVANVTKEMDREVKTMKALFNRTTNTFANKPPFYTEVNQQEGDLVGMTYTPITNEEGKRYSYLNFGTRVRWAVMSRNFKAKTRARMLTSYKGAGKAVLIGKKAMQARGIPPRPGIKARRFDLAITIIRRPIFKQNIDRAIREASK